MNEVEEYINNLKNRLAEVENAKNQSDAAVTANSIYNAANDQNHNIIEYQLEFDDIISHIEHLIRGHIVRRKEDGTEYWYEPKEDEQKLFNDYGTGIIMGVVRSYLNRNTILSNYEEDIINLKTYDIGIELTDIVYCQYEKMGLDCKEKKERYNLIIREIVDMINSAYLRAMNGGERTNIKSARMIMQQEGIGDLSANKVKSKFSLIKPTTWVR